MTERIIRTRPNGIQIRNEKRPVSGALFKPTVSAEMIY